MEIKSYIPIGHENAVTIDTLMNMTGLSNRAVRRAIAESDAIILNLQDGKGYFRMNPRTKAERAFAEKYSAQEKSRGWAVLKKAFKVDKRLKGIENRGAVYRMARVLAGLEIIDIVNALDVDFNFVVDVELGYVEPSEEYHLAFEELVGLEI